MIIEAAMGMLAMIFLLLMLTSAMGDWAKAQQDAGASDRSFALLRGVLTPAAWTDCVAPHGNSASPLVPSVPAECAQLALEPEVRHHRSYVVDYKDFYRLTPHTAGCDPEGTQAASVRTATVAAVLRDGGSNRITRIGEEQRDLRSTRWAWTAVSRGTLGPGPLLVDVWRQVPVPGQVGGTQLEDLGEWRFPSDDTLRTPDPNESCNVIVVPVGHGVRYRLPGTLVDVSCVLASEGPNPPC